MAAKGSRRQGDIPLLKQLKQPGSLMTEKAAKDDARHWLPGRRS